MVEGLIILGVIAAVALSAVFFGVNTRDSEDWYTHNKI
jgi:hypothetical protein